MKYLELITEPKQADKIIFIDFTTASKRVSETKLIELLSKAEPSADSLEIVKGNIAKEFGIWSSTGNVMGNVEAKVIGFKSDTGLFGFMI